jgi:hypothetical protein
MLAHAGDDRAVLPGILKEPLHPLEPRLVGSGPSPCLYRDTDRGVRRPHNR